MDVSQAGEEKPTPATAEARAVLEQIEWGKCKVPTRRQAPDLEAAIAAAISEGWTCTQVRAHIRTALGEVKDPKKAAIYVLGALTTHLPMRPPAQKTPVKAPEMAPQATPAPTAPSSPNAGYLRVKEALKAATKKTKNRTHTPRPTPPAHHTPSPHSSRHPDTAAADLVDPLTGNNDSCQKPSQEDPDAIRALILKSLASVEAPTKPRTPSEGVGITGFSDAA